MEPMFDASPTQQPRYSDAIHLVVVLILLLMLLVCRSYFTTDFGVTFGMLICFDMQFYQPMASMVKRGVHDIVVSSLYVFVGW
jgi:hypothetical protein